MAFGYRYDEVGLPLPISVKKDAVVYNVPDARRVKEQLPSFIRPVVAVDLGCHLEGALLPHPDPSDPETMLAGVFKRFACATPKAELPLLEELREFVRKWIRRNLVPLEATTDVSFETWVAHTNYPEWRREELRKVAVKLISKNAQRNWCVKSFQKDEHYVDYKHARGINARVDEAKVILGPFFKQIEDVLYRHPAFIKHVPVAERPKLINRVLYRLGAKYLATDYTSFEALFIPVIMEAVEFELYEYMLSLLPDGPEIMSLIREHLGGLNQCQFKHFVVELVGVRMSGEMCTSLGNGFSNLMFMLFTAHKHGQTEEPPGFVEGDDGLFLWNGEVPTGDWFERLGLRIKMEVHEDLAAASFCGNIFDTEDLQVISDPKKLLAMIGWTSGKYVSSGSRKLQALLRCKALSTWAAYPACPIITALAHYVLRVTDKVGNYAVVKAMQARGWDGWQRDRNSEALRQWTNREHTECVPGVRTRMLMERVFGVSIEQQRYVENYLHAKEELGPLHLPWLVDVCPPSWRSYWASYVFPETVGTTPPLPSRTIGPLGKLLGKCLVSTPRGPKYLLSRLAS